MPTYDYRCKKCGRRFSQVMSLSRHEKAKGKCPKCGSRSVQQLFAPFLVKTSKKS